jgi:phage/conjugal plasmid C-4 type zinc finger TraR family protein
MDEGDYGQDYQARLNAEAIAKHKRKNGNHPPAPSSTAGGGAVCSWCGDEIPEARLVAVLGCELCVTCQEIKERFPERIK